MKTQQSKKLLVALLVLLIASAVITIFVRQHLERQTNLASAIKPTAAPPEQVEPPPAPAAVPGNPQSRRSKPPLMDPKAREALPLVGADWVATEYWLGAINNSTIPEHERSDLIEDLNENGFTNNKRPNIEDLPLIETRITLIEMLAPSAMDRVNADAFQEAYKDLTNMRARLLGLPDPPRRNLYPR